MVALGMGKAVTLNGITLAGGVVTRVASPIKLQADMGLLPALMFLVNMLGAHFLLPVATPDMQPAPEVVPEALPLYTPKTSSSTLYRTT